MFLQNIHRGQTTIGSNPVVDATTDNNNAATAADELYSHTRTQSDLTDTIPKPLPGHTRAASTEELSASAREKMPNSKQSSKEPRRHFTRRDKHKKT